MAYSTSRLRYLLQRYTERQASSAELDELEESLEMNWKELEPGRAAPGVDWPAMLEAILTEDRVVPAVHRLRPGRRWLVAAGMLTLVGTGVWWVWRTEERTGSGVALNPAPADIAAPASNRATLMLGGGQRVDLESVSRGDIAIQGAVQVVKTADGVIAYAGKGHGNQELLYNTLVNPRGSKVIGLTLGDGTKVWLNAASSLRYPVAFGGGKRAVEMTGEAYFEVAAERSRPFRVKSGKVEVDVLGTDFNVNAYADEPGQDITLVEGKVRVRATGDSVLLRPDEQAGVGERIHVSKDVDLDRVLAWKNGRFAFANADLAAVLREVARWYDVDVRYEGKAPEMRFSGKIGRTLTLAQLLKTLGNEGVRYRIESGEGGKARLVILP